MGIATLTCYPLSTPVDNSCAHRADPVAPLLGSKKQDHPFGIAQKYAKGLGLLFGSWVTVVKAHNQCNNSVALAPSDRVALPKEVVVIDNTAVRNAEMANKSHAHKQTSTNCRFAQCSGLIGVGLPGFRSRILGVLGWPKYVQRSKVCLWQAL